MEYEKILSTAKIGLMDPSNKPPEANPVFYSSVLFSLHHKWATAQEGTATAGIDGKTLYLNPDWFKSLRPDARVGLLAHEVGHILYRHIESFPLVNMKVYSEKVEHQLYNRAGDHRINLDLLKAGYTLPDDGLWDNRFIDCSTLEIYHILHKEYDPATSNLDEQDCDIILQKANTSTAEGEEVVKDLTAHINAIICKARCITEMSGKSIGSLPGEVRGLMEEILNPRLNFETILANHMQAYAQTEYSFKRPSRRFLPEILPSCYGISLSNIACAFDVSISVTQEELSSFGGGIRMIKDQLLPEKITLIEFDTTITAIQDITQNTRVEDIAYTGGGGTDLTELMQWVEENQPPVILIFTDGYFRIPVKPKTNTDIIWIIHDNLQFDTPYGRVIHYKL